MTIQNWCTVPDAGTKKLRVESMYFTTKKGNSHVPNTGNSPQHYVRNGDGLMPSSNTNMADEGAKVNTETEELRKLQEGDQTHNGVLKLNDHPKLVHRST